MLSAPNVDELYRVMKFGEVEKIGFLSLSADEIYKELNTGSRVR
jgi:hypothetical protein